MIKAVLFDCDGLMFETELLSQQMWYDEAAKAGVTLPDDFFMHITGTSGPREEEYLAEVLKGTGVRAAMRKRRFDPAFWLSLDEDFLNKYGLVELVQYLRSHGYLTAVCSSSGREYVEMLLSKVSVPLVFEAVIGGKDVTHSKPDPEIFLKGAAALGADPSECLVLEDSKNGILAARNAGMRSVFIRDTIEPDAEMKQAIDISLFSLMDVIDLLEGNLDVKL